MTGATWRIELLGGLRAVHEDRIATRFRTRKTGLLLAYLACHLPLPQPRELLLELLWPGYEPSLARNNLSKELSALRRLLEPPGVPAGAILRADRLTAGLNPTAVSSDVARFGAALQAAARAQTESERRERLAEAVELYGGEFLPGCFEEWVLTERQRLAEAVFQALRQLSAALAQAGDGDGALRRARQATGAEPLREEAARDLMRLLAAREEPEAALRHYAQLEQRLAAELGAAPEAETAALARALAQRGTAVREARRGEEPPDAACAGAVAAAPDGAPPVVLPTGTMTFLLAEVGESAAVADPTAGDREAAAGRGWERLGPVLRGYGGIEAAAWGGRRLFLFGRASGALAAALAGRAELEWPPQLAPVVRMALHTGEVEPDAVVQQSPGLTQTARLLAAAHPGQTLFSEAAAAFLLPGRAAAAKLTELGLFRLGPGMEPERLFQADEPGAARRSFPPPNAQPAVIGSLPPQFTRFFGREAEIERLCELLKEGVGGRRQTGDGGRRAAGGGSNRLPPPDPRPPSPVHRPPSAASRLVTLTGPGGSGKTRLAQEVAARALQYGRAAWFVSLVDIHDPAQIPGRLLAALRVPPAPGVEPLDQVVALLSSPRFTAKQAPLLLLDNFEQLIPEGAALVQLLLERIAALTCLVTSRQRLNLEAEQEFPVGPLPVPGVQAFGRSGAQAFGPARIEHEHEHEDDSNARTPERLKAEHLNTEHLSALMQCPSVRIFLDRAQAARPDFQLTHGNAAAVAELCRQLEGIPLALELAAARAPVLTPRQMLAHLERRFDLLVSRRHGAHERHRSLRATLDWSFHLLPQQLRQLFAQLSVFRGGWTLEAAEQVCGDEAALLESLQQLCGASLILAEESGGEMRYRMLETLREYAGEQLAAADAEALQRRHAEFYLALAERTEERLKGRGQGDGRSRIEWLEALEREHDNLGAALAWSQAAPDGAEIGLSMAGALQHVWQRRGHWGEARAWLEAALDHAAGARPTVAYAKALCSLANLDWLQGRFADARLRAIRSLAVARELGDRRWQAYALLQLGATLDAQGEFASACVHWEKGLPLFREVDDPWGVALCLDLMAHACRALGDEDRARTLWAESDALFQELGDLQALSWQRDRLAKAALEQGDGAAARAYYEEGLAMRRALRDRSQIARSLLRLGSLAQANGDAAAARRHYLGSLDLQRDLGDRPDMLLSLRSLALLALQEGDTEQAAGFARERLVLADELRNARAAAQSLTTLARVAFSRGEAARAARWLAAARSLSMASGPASGVPGPDGADGLATAARAALGPAAFAAAWAEGLAMTMAEAIRRAVSP